MSKSSTHKRGSLLISSIITLVLCAGALLALYFQDDNRAYAGVSLTADAVKCAQAADAADALAEAINDAQKSPPDYSGIKRFGFTAPTTPADAQTTLQLAKLRLTQLDAKAVAQQSHTCVDAQSVSVVDVDGTTKNLPLVSGDQPLMPVSASESNDDPRTEPITIGTPSDGTITNSWTQLNDLYGTTQWYVDCANTNLSMNWNNEVPKFIATEEGGQDSRFILAVNTDSSLDDDEIRRRAAASNSIDTADLTVVRTPAIINTRHMERNRCDQFIDTRSQLRISLGRLLYDEAGNFKSIEMTQGTFVDCHNLWRLPKSVPTPIPTTTTAPPTTVTTPPTNPPTLQPKNPNGGPAAQGNVPTQVRGTNPAPATTAETRPADPPATYNPPAPPAATTAPAPVRTTVPPAPPKPNPTTPFDPCNPVTPACG